MIPLHRAAQPLLMWFYSLFIFNRAKVESHGDAVEQIASWHRFVTSGDLFFELNLCDFVVDVLKLGSIASLSTCDVAVLMLDGNEPVCCHSFCMFYLVDERQH